jgi:hypothetical protein
VARPEQVNFKIAPIEPERLDRLRAFYGGRSDGEVLRHMIWLADRSLALGDESRLLAVGEGAISAALSTQEAPVEYACRMLRCTREELTEVGREFALLGGPFTRSDLDNVLGDIGSKQPSDVLKRVRARAKAR